MRKRRRLADKLTIMVCAVLVAVSAFFYAPMDVEAQENNFTYSGSANLGSQSLSFINIVSDKYNLIDSPLSGSDYARVVFDFNAAFVSDRAVSIRNFVMYYNSRVVYAKLTPTSSDSNLLNYTFSSTVDMCVPVSALYDKDFLFNLYFISPTAGQVNYDFEFDFDLRNIIYLTGEESASYQQGYNAGYSAGEQVGESNGYSNGYSDGYEAGEQSGYDSGYDAGVQDGFQSGQGSVDTQSYYDAGYNAGYDTGYLEGYDEGYNLGYDEGFSAGEAVGYEKGYESGWQAFKDKISGWGADTTDYPLLLLDKPLMSRVFDISVKSSIPTQYSDFGEWTTDLIYNPNHTYRFNVVLNPTEYKEGSADIYFLNEDIFYLNIGGIKYRISNFSTAYVNTFFVPGDRMSSAFSFSWEPLLAVMGDTFESGTAYCYYDLNYQIYDMGPSGDTQNHIANQTDQLTGGYNDSQGNSVNNEFSSGLNEFETAEDSLFATATTGLKDFTFFDIQSVPAMVTGMSFVGSIMSGWFTQAGGASGVGIVLSILFSIMLVAMVLGLYRWYQSKGGKD